LGRLLAPVEPPADMKKRIRAKIHSKGGTAGGTSSRGTRLGATGWALAAGLAIVSIWLWSGHENLVRQLASGTPSVVAPVTKPLEKDKVLTLEDELKKLREDSAKKTLAQNAEIEALHKREAEDKARIAKLTTEAEVFKQQEASSKMQIATLQSKIWEYRRSEMTIVWDGDRGQGVLMLERMPSVESGKDYQLWVVDPTRTDPVSAGIVKVDKNGSAKTHFKPTANVNGEAKFALSVEKKGGVPKGEGPVVLIGP